MDSPNHQRHVIMVTEGTLSEGTPLVILGRT